MIKAKAIKKMGKGNWDIELHNEEDLNEVKPKIQAIAEQNEAEFSSTTVHVYSYPLYKKIFERQIITK